MTPPGAVILVAGDLGPADVAELDAAVAGIALAGGGPSAHAAVVARGLGMPMVVGLGPELLASPDGAELALDGDGRDARGRAGRGARRRRHAPRGSAASASARAPRPPPRCRP